MKYIHREEVKEYTMGFRDILGTAKLQHKAKIKNGWGSKLFFSEITLGKLFKMLTSFLAI